MRVWWALLRAFYSDYGPEEAERLASLPFRERSSRITELIRHGAGDPHELALLRWRNAWDRASALEVSFEQILEESPRTYFEQTREVLNELRLFLEETPFRSENLPLITKELALVEVELCIPDSPGWRSLANSRGRARQVDFDEIAGELKTLEALNARAREVFNSAAASNKRLKEAEVANASEDEIATLKSEADAAEQRFRELAERAFLFDKELEAKVIVFSAQASVSDMRKHFEAIANLNVNFKQKYKKPARVDPASGTESALPHEPPNSDM